jgi:CDP-diacylglycerol--glycerol-3-phosphate 3-phosphatidyltransferase
MRFIPNMLSVSRIPLGGLAFTLAITGFWAAACVVLIAGALTDFIDGVIARRLGVASDFGRRVLDPLGDMTLTVASLMGLLVSGVWPWWIGVVLLSGIVTLQTIAFVCASKKNRLMSVLKKAQRILQPILNLLLLFCMGATYLYVAAGGGIVGLVMIMALLVIAVGLGFYRQERLKAFLTDSY